MASDVWQELIEASRSGFYSKSSGQSDPAADLPPMFPEGTVRHGPRKGITCGGEFFKSQDALKQRVRERIVRPYKNGRRFVESDLQFVVNVLSLAADGYADKMSGGVVAGWIEPNERFNPSGFGENNWTIHIKRADGLVSDVSWTQAISLTNHKGEVKRAMRFDIAHQIIEFKEGKFLLKGDQEGCLVCPVLKVPVDKWTCEVHHESPTFDELVARFIDEHFGGNFDLVTVADLGNLQTGIRLADDAVRKSWQEFHQANARLVIMSAEGHKIHERSARGGNGVNQ
jgi:hypothetical protein